MLRGVVLGWDVVVVVAVVVGDGRGRGRDVVRGRVWGAKRIGPGGGERVRGAVGGG